MTPMEVLRAAAVRAVGSVPISIAVKVAGVLGSAVAVRCAIVSDDHAPGFSEASRTQYVRRSLVFTCLETPPGVRTGDRATYDGVDFTIQGVSRNALGLPQVTASHTKRTGFSGSDAMIAEGE